MSHLNHKAHYTRTINRSNTIASTLFVILAALALVLTIVNWDTISIVLRTLGVIG